MYQQWKQPNNLTLDRVAFGLDPDFRFIWDDWQLSSSMTSVKVSLLFLLETLVLLLELFQVRPCWYQLLV